MISWFSWAEWGVLIERVHLSEEAEWAPGDYLGGEQWGIWLSHRMLIRGIRERQLHWFMWAGLIRICRDKQTLLWFFREQALWANILGKKILTWHSDVWDKDLNIVFFFYDSAIHEFQWFSKRLMTWCKFRLVKPCWQGFSPVLLMWGCRVFPARDFCLPVWGRELGLQGPILQC